MDSRWVLDLPMDWTWRIKERPASTVTRRFWPELGGSYRNEKAGEGPVSYGGRTPLCYARNLSAVCALLWELWKGQLPQEEAVDELSL